MAPRTSRTACVGSSPPPRSYRAAWAHWPAPPNGWPDGIGRLQRGSDQLADGLGQGATRSEKLQDGLGTARDRTRRAATADQGDEIARLRDRSPRLLDSRYFVLAALDGSTRGARTQAGFAVSLEGGGQAARITIVPDSGPNSPDTRALNDRLQGEGDRLAADSGARVNVGGVAAQLTDYQRALGSILPLLIVALSIITFLVLIPSSARSSSRR